MKKKEKEGAKSSPIDQTEEKQIKEKGLPLETKKSPHHSSASKKGSSKSR